MTKKIDYTTMDLAELQEIHSKLCAEAGDLGLSVAEYLTVDFDAEEQGAAICEELATLVGLESGVAEGVEQEQDAPTTKTKKKAVAKKAKATKSTEADDGPAQQQESDMTTTTTKKTATKSTKKAARSSARKPVAAKKAKTTSVKRVPREGNKTADVVALMKRAKGVTRAEVLELTGWKAVSMQQLAKSAGVKLKVSEERPFHYKVA